MNKSADIMLRRLKDYLAPHGAVSEFSRATGIPRRNLDNWLTGTAIPLDAIEAIAKGMGVTPWELIKPEGDQTTQRMSRSALIGEIVVLLSHLNDSQLFGVFKNIEALVLGSRKDKDLVRKNR